MWSFFLGLFGRFAGTFVVGERSERRSDEPKAREALSGRARQIKNVSSAGVFYLAGSGPISLGFVEEQDEWDEEDSC